MKLPKLKHGDAIQIRWEDANSPPENEWVSVEEFKVTSPRMEILSVGFFIEQRDGYVRMSGERSDSEEFVEVVLRVFNVPLGCVKSVRRLK